MAQPDSRESFPVLQRFIRQAAQAAEAARERCDLCGETIPPQHRHLLEVASREVRCACRACSILFDREIASLGKYRLIPERCLYLASFRMSEAQWEDLRI